MEEKKRKLMCLTISQKLEIVNLIKSCGMTRKKIAECYGCNLSTISRIMKQEEKLRSIEKANKNTFRKRLKKGNYEKIEKAISMWFREMQAKDVVINGPMVLEKAKEFSKMFGISDFEPSNGWLGRWKIRENVSFRQVQVEKSPADRKEADGWIRNVLPSLMENYDEINIFTAGESGLLYKALPNGILASKGEDVEEMKIQNDRLTLLFICNMDGTEKYVCGIGSSKNPHCFRGKKKLPVPYYANAKSWMTNNLWTNILLELDDMCATQQRHILLFVNDATCHKLESGISLKYIKIEFLPPNTTSIRQPLDQGIIRAFKVYYRQQIIRKQQLFLQREESLASFAKTIDVWEALNMIKQSWDLVTSVTIKNCYRKAGFSFTKENEILDHDMSPLIKLDIPEDEFYDFVKIDENLDCYGELNNEDIVDEINDASENVCSMEGESTKVSIDSEIKTVPTKKEAASALIILNDYFSSNSFDMSGINALTAQFFEHPTENLVQKNLTDFFD